LDLLPISAQQASLQRFSLIPTSFLLKGWSATSGDGARSGNPLSAAKKVLQEPKCVDTTRECVDTLSHFCKTVLLGTETSVDTAWDYVDTLSQSGNWVFWILGLASTLLDPVSTLLDHFYFILPWV
ncbi:hypothetical protein Taro_035286, partial [Colocasia esculenta]|nr:hypothetical protein [Colocasia esculenta]